MKIKHLTLVVAIASAFAGSAAQAEVQLGDMFTLRGYGTVGAVKSVTDNDDADFVSDVTQPNGAGASHSVDGGVDSKLGLQLDGKLTDSLSVVAQVVSERNYDKTFTPKLEWANAKYQLTPDLSVRAGRFALPLFMVSDFRKVGYANPWVRPPIEVYRQLPISNIDGVDAIFRANMGEVQTTLQLGYGKTKAKDAGENDIEANKLLVANITAEMGSLSVRGGFAKTKIDYTGTNINALFNGVKNFAAGTAGLAPAASAEASRIASDYEAVDKDATFTALGFTYDPGTMLLQGEYVQRKSETWVANSKGWYLTGGYRFGNYMPYATLSAIDYTNGTKIGTIPVINATAAFLNASLDGLRQRTTIAQDNIAIGVRADIMKNIALKAQFEQIKVKDEVGVRGTALGSKPNDKFNVYSIAVDFVF